MLEKNADWVVLKDDELFLAVVAPQILDMAPSGSVSGGISKKTKLRQYIFIHMALFTRRN